jgi:hypothetical protein
MLKDTFKEIPRTSDWNIRDLCPRNTNIKGLFGAKNLKSSEFLTFTPELPSCKRPSKAKLKHK